MSAYDCSCMLERALGFTYCLFISPERKGEFTQKELSTLRHITAVHDSRRTSILLFSVVLAFAFTATVTGDEGEKN